MQRKASIWGMQTVSRLSWEKVTISFHTHTALDAQVLVTLCLGNVTFKKACVHSWLCGPLQLGIKAAHAAMSASARPRAFALAFTSSCLFSLLINISKEIDFGLQFSSPLLYLLWTLGKLFNLSAHPLINKRFHILQLLGK